MCWGHKNSLSWLRVHFPALRSLARQEHSAAKAGPHTLGPHSCWEMRLHTEMYLCDSEANLRSALSPLPKGNIQSKSQTHRAGNVTASHQLRGPWDSQASDTSGVAS